MALRGLVPGALEVSARTGKGIDALIAKIAELIPQPNLRIEAVIPYNRGELVSKLHLNSKILSLEYIEEGTKLTALVRPEVAAELEGFITARE